MLVELVLHVSVDAAQRAVVFCPQVDCDGITEFNQSQFEIEWLDSSYFSRDMEN